MNDREMVESKRTNGLFTKTDLMDLNKTQQLLILKEDIGLTDNDISRLKNETIRVKKILQLQKKVEEIPKEEVDRNKPELKPGEKVKVNGLICDRCASVMRHTGGGPSGQDYHCDSCGLNTTK